MTVCIDTNVVLGMFGRNGPWLTIRQALIDGRLIWAVTTEILLEYEEVAAREMGIASSGYHPQPITPAEFISKHL